MSEEKMRASFEADAAAYGFDMTRQESAAPEPWSEYLEMETGMRWGGFIAGYEAALQESEAGVVYECPKCGAEMEISMTATPSSGYFLIAPQSAQAIETAAIMKCVEVCEKAAHGVAGAGIFAEAVRALIPQDGRTKLEEFGMKCIDDASALNPQLWTEHNLRAIVTNLIGTTK